MTTRTRAELTYADYAAREEGSEERHEFLDGEVFAMSGGTLEHSALIGAVYLIIGNQLAGGPCRAFEGNARVRTSKAHGTYADVTVVCGTLERDPEDADSILNPTVLVEVLSPSTEKYDRTKKFERYRNLPNFVEYVLVAYDEPRIESHARNRDGTWTETFAKAGESLTLRSIGVTIDVDAVYRGLVSDGERMVLA
jgi:Uma2 family endonuclease